MKKRILIFIFLISIGLVSLSADQLTGNITDMTSIKLGLLIKVNSDWMLIKQEDKVMTSVALIAWMQNIPVSIYHTGVIYQGYVVINQVDPIN